VSEYLAHNGRYEQIEYRRCGRSGLLLPAISLGLWQNFGGVDGFENGRAMLRRAFDLGITHFDLGNNYGPPPGSAEETLGRALKLDLAPYRDELIISTKAGYDMWPGPHGNWGSRKYLLASLDQSLKRMGLEYVDIFYSHRPDPATPVEETMSALKHAVHSGKALYAGISNYNVEQSRAAIAALRAPCLIHQMRYSMFQRTPESGLFELLAGEGIGGIAFTPLAQGLLTDRYLNGIPPESRAAKGRTSLQASQITESRIAQIRALDALAHERGQTLAQMALAWVLRQSAITSALIGASRVQHIEQGVAALAHTQFEDRELARIEQILTQ